MRKYSGVAQHNTVGENNTTRLEKNIIRANVLRMSFYM